MKHFIRVALLAILLYGIFNRAHAQNTVQLKQVWKKQLAGISGDEILNDMAVHPDGTVLVGGRFAGGSVDLGGATIGMPGSASDGFLVQYSVNGTPNWGTQYNYNQNETFFGVTYGAGKIPYAFGGANTGIGNFSYANLSIVSANGTTGALTGSLTNNGNAINNFFCAATDGAGMVYGGGWYQRANGLNFDINAGRTPAVNLLGNGTEQAVIAKYDANRNVVWAKQFGGVHSDLVREMTIVGQYIYAVGTFSGTVDFDPSVNTFNLTSSAAFGVENGFLLKLDTAGNFVNAWHFSGTTANGLMDVAVNDAGHIFLAAYFTGSADVDFGTGTTTLTSAGADDAVLIKLDADGNMIWNRQFGGTTLDKIHRIALNNQSDVYIGGYFTSASIDVGFPNANVLANAGTTSTYDAFLAGYDSTGNSLCGYRYGSIAGNEHILALGFDSLSNLYVAGYFAGSMETEVVPGYSSVSNSVGGYDGFVIKYNTVCPYLGKKIPFDQVACSGKNVLMNADVFGNNLTYQWKFNGANVSNGAKYTGVNNDSLVINNLQSADTGYYHLQVSRVGCASFVSDSIMAKLNTGILATAPSFFYRFEGNLLENGGGTVAIAPSFTYTTDRYGNANKAINQASASSRIDVPNLASWQYTVSMWVSHASTATQTLVWGGGTFKELQIKDGKLGLNNGQFVDFGYTLAQNTWYHIGFVRDTSRCIVYVNGEKIYDNATALYGFTGQIAVIMGANGSTEATIGKCDELRMYNRSLSHEEIQSLYLMPQKLSVKKQLASCAGGNEVIQTKISGAQYYQWYKEGVALSNNSSYAGVTTDSLVISNVQNAESGNYYLQASNDCVVLNSDTTSVYIGATQLAQNFAANFKFNNTIADATGNIIATGTVSYVATGHFGNNGQCASFLPASGRTSLSFAPITNDTLSVSLWFQRNTSTGISRTLLSSNTSNGRHLTMNTVNQLGYTNTAGTFVSSGVNIDANIWYHIVVTKMGNNQKIYVDGQLVMNSNSSFLNSITANALTRIGGASGSLEPAYGYIDDVRIYTRELNPLEVVGLSKIFEVSTNPEPTSACNGIDNISLSASFEDGDTTHYTMQWKKDGVAITNGTKYTGVNGKTLQVNLVSHADTGMYALEATPVGLTCLSTQSTPARVSIVSPNQLHDSLRLHLRFSNSVNDASSFNRSTISAGNTYTNDKFGVANSAAVFNGSTSYTATSGVMPAGSRSFTIMAWFKANQSTGGIVSSANQVPTTTPTEFHSLLYIGTNNKLCGKIFNGNTTPMISAADVNDNVWHHAALVVTATQQYLYLDGVQVGTQPANSVSLLSTYILVGNAYGGWPQMLPGWTNFLQGNIDEVKVYNKSLSANEMSRVVQDMGFAFSGNQTVGYCNATPVVIASQAQGSGVMYQWYKNGVAISNSANLTGTDSAALSFVSIGASDSGNYQCAITKNCYTIFSDTIKVGVYTTISVVANPQSGNVCLATTLTLGVKASGASLQYQWKKSGVNLINGGRVSGATSDTLRITGATTSDADSYTVDIADACSNTATSTAAAVTVNSFQYAGANTTKAIYPLNGNANASVAALNGVAINMGSAINRFNENASALNFTRTSSSRVTLPVNMFAAGNPAFTVSIWFKTSTPSTTMGLIGTASGNPTANPTTGWSPILFINNAGKLSGKFYDVNGSAHESVSAVTDGVWHQALLTGNGTSQSLYLDGVIVATNYGSYTTTLTPYTIIGASYSASNGWYGHNNGWQYFNGTLDDARFYTSYFTANEVLAQFSKPEIAVQPQATNLVCVGAASPTINATVNGSNLIYQWYKNGVELNNSGNVTGATTNSVNIANVQTADTGYYYARVISGCNYITTDSSRVVLNTVPDVLTSPMDQSSCVGGSASLSVSATGTGLTYQWQKEGVNLTNGGNISGATASVLTISSLAYNDTMNYRCIVSNLCGVDTSATAKVTLGTTLQILQQPISQNVCENSSAILFVKSTDPLATYTWKRNGITLSNSNNDTISFSGFNGNNIGNYQVIVNSVCGIDTSDVAGLSILDATEIIAQPNAITSICGVNPIVMSVTANGTNLTYQWQKGGIDIPNATNATYTKLNPLPTDTGDYRVLVSGDCGSLIPSTVSRVNIYQPISITTQPVANITICSGTNDNLSLTVAATGSIVRYQWLKDGNPINNVNGAVSGATSNNLQFRNSWLGTGNYSCRIYGNCDTVTSTATVFGYTPFPSISTSPLSKTICEGSDVSFKVTATSATGYQWYINNSPVNDIPNKIQGSLTDSITAFNVSAADLGGATTVNIYVLVLNGCTNQYSTSNVVNLTLVNGITISQQSDTLISVCENQSTVIYVNSSTEATYVWKRNGVVIPNETNDTLIFNAVTSADNASFMCEATSTCGVTSSLPIRLNVLTLTVPIISQNGNELSTTSFLGYQWYKNSSVIENATQQTYTPSESGMYSVRVINSSGCLVFSAAFNFTLTGINDVFVNGKKVSVYPNPTEAILTIETNDMALSSTIEVFDMTGKRVASIVMDNGKLDVSDLPVGMYILKLTSNDNQTGFVKFTKQ